jgi:hypothetical protein
MWVWMWVWAESKMKDFQILLKRGQCNRGVIVLCTFHLFNPKVWPEPATFYLSFLERAATVLHDHDIAHRACLLAGHPKVSMT